MYVYTCLNAGCWGNKTSNFSVGCQFGYCLFYIMNLKAMNFFWFDGPDLFEDVYIKRLLLLSLFRKIVLLIREDLPELFCLRNHCIVCHLKMEHRGTSQPLCARELLESISKPSSQNPTSRIKTRPNLVVRLTNWCLYKMSVFV